MGNSPFDKIKQNRHIKVKQHSVTIEFGWVKVILQNKKVKQHCVTIEFG